MSSGNLNDLSIEELNKILKEEYEKNKKIKKRNENQKRMVMKSIIKNV